MGAASDLTFPDLSEDLRLLFGLSSMMIEGRELGRARRW